MILILVLFLVLVYVTILSLTKPRRFARLFSIRTFSQAVETNDSLAQKTKVLADQYYKEKNFLAAEKAYLKILKTEHNNWSAYNRLGLIYSHLNNMADAIECFTIAADLKSTATLFYNLSMIHFKNRNFADAAKNLEKSLELEPNHITRMLALARTYRILDKYDQQVELLTKINLLSKNNVDPLILLAEAYLNKRDQTNARKVFRKILKIDPRNKRALAGLTNQP